MEEHEPTDYGQEEDGGILSDPNSDLIENIDEITGQINQQETEKHMIGADDSKLRENNASAQAEDALDTSGVQEMEHAYSHRE